jgi:hypothetical protein
MRTSNMWYVIYLPYLPKVDTIMSPCVTVVSWVVVVSLSAKLILSSEPPIEFCADELSCIFAQDVREADFSILGRVYPYVVSKANEH